MEHRIPSGFQLAGVHAGIKQASPQNDLCLFVADENVVASGTYTTNLVRSAAVIRDEQLTPCNDCRAIVINSGNANACTGTRGASDNDEMARLVAEEIGAKSEQVLVMSTGVIGHFLPMDKIASGIKSAVASLRADAGCIHDAAQAIMTTDTKEKIVSRQFTIDEKEYRLIGFAKGAGMIGPNMATMLSVILTDAPLTSDESAAALRSAVNASFNCVSVDGHMSTSDTCVMLSSGNAELSANFDTVKFTTELKKVCTELARMIAGDGEGASHLVTIDVSGCKTDSDSQIIAKTIANSALAKTAIAGNDPNWGRIVSAAGYSGVEFDPTGCSLSINGVSVFANGMPTDFEAEKLSANMKDNWEVEIDLSFAEGDCGCRFWTCDLTTEYVHINADYHT